MIPDPGELDRAAQEAAAAAPDEAHAHRSRPVPWRLLPESARVGDDGWLTIGGCSTADLVAEFGTPLFVYDEDHLRARCREAVATFGEGVSYAGKAFLCLAMARLVHEEGFQVKRPPGGEVEFRNRHGLLVPNAPEPPRQPIDPHEALVKRLEDDAVVVDPYTGTPNWDGTPPDLAAAVEWYLSRTATPERKEREAAQLEQARSVHQHLRDRGWRVDDTSWARDWGSTA